jgi:hypothetical protein
VRARTELRQAMVDQVDENGAAKNKRRMSRLLVKAASITDIVEVTEDEAVAEVDTEDVDMAEAVNLEDAEVTAAVATRPLCSNCSLATNDLNDKRGFLCAVSKVYLHDDFFFSKRFGSEEEFF